MTCNTLSRRQMILASGIAITSVSQYQHATAQQLPDEDLVFRTTNPRNAEPQLDDLVAAWITPNKHFYIRSHAPNPEIDVANYRLQVEGLVDNPLTLSMDDLRKFPEHSVTATLTCAGNRRIEFNKQAEVGGVQWESGAIGNATWTGVALLDVLKAAGVRNTAKHIWFDGLDEVPHEGDVIPFGASIPMEKAQEAGGKLGALLVYAMNGQALTADHGFPLRTIVPGYIGARSVKWLGRIVASDRTSPNHYLATAYKIVTQTDALAWAESGPIYRNVINAAIATIDEERVGEAAMAAGPVRLRGYALPSGVAGAKLKRVLISTDSGEHWTPAEMLGEENEYCWQLWRATVSLTTQSTEIIVRAIDSNNAFMPARMPWNAKGYLQNAWYRVPVTVN